MVRIKANIAVRPEFVEGRNRGFITFMVRQAHHERQKKILKRMSQTLPEKVFSHPCRQSDTTRNRVQGSFVIASRAIRSGFSAKV
jgi:hypothetical protein